MTYLDDQNDPYKLNTGAKGGGGGMPIFLLLILAPFVIIGSYFLIPIFPVAGTIAVVAGEVASQVMEANDGFGTGGPMRVLVMAVVIIVALIFAMSLEQTAERRIPRYRQIRHWIRVVGLALMINEIGFYLFYYFMGNIEYARGWELYNGVTIEKLLRVAALMLIVHVIFRLFATRGSGMSMSKRLSAPGRWG